MKKTVSPLLTTLILLCTSTLFAQELNDPFKIYEHHIEAMGGVDRLDSLESVYTEGEIVIPGTGLEGPLKNWKIFPDKHRTEIDLTLIQFLEGDNGDIAWEVDTNGKLKIKKDEESLKRREIARRMTLDEHTDPNSDIFTSKLLGTEEFEEYNCYKIMITNSLNDDTLIRYFDIDSFMIRREIGTGPDGKTEMIFSDYREINGIPNAFRQKTIQHTNNMVQEIELTEYNYNLEMDSALFEPPAEDVKDFEFVEGDQAENIDFIYHADHIFLEVNMGCRHSLWVLDTGSGMTVIDSSFADRIGLEFEGQMTGQGAGALVQVYFVSLPPFEVDKISFAGQKAIAIDLSDIMKKSGLKFDGILGYDFLSRLTTRIDYANELISFYDPASFTYTGNGIVIDAPIADQTFVVPAVVDGKYEGLWSLDTGAGSCSFHAPFASKYNLYDRDGIEFVGTGAGGTFVEKMMRFDAFELAGHVIDEPLIDAAKSAESGAFQQADVVGNLGNSVMENFVMTLDYKNQQVIFEPGDKFNKPDARDRSGMQVMESDDGNIEIYHVAEKTPADKAGLKVGDIITAVNGIEIKHLDGLGGFKGLMKKAEGTEYRLTVMREGKIKEHKLKLKKYI